MSETPDPIDELTERIASILDLPEDEQKPAFRELREQHPQQRDFLRRCEEAAQRVAPAGDLRETLAQVLAAGAVEDEAPERIGSYRILELLGEGGMGTVYLADQEAPVCRRVALKVIKLGMDTREVIARFEAERQALAMMEHDNIAKVFDAGATARGRPYFVMEYIQGVSLTSYCDERCLDIEERLALLIQVCAGVQHAHQKGVIHRDLKPSNVLVADVGTQPVPKIIDFGLARATDYRGLQQTIFTQSERILGTPEYMSLEQAGLGALDIDTRTDVYSLGVLLYEMLVGELPYSRDRKSPAGLLDIQRTIRESSPVLPSVRIRTTDSMGHAKNRRSEPRVLFRTVRRDLDWITMKALEKDRTRRYATAASLAEDLQRFLDGQPVHAGPPSTWYWLRKLLLRHRAKVAAAAVMLVLLGAGIVSTLVQTARAQRALDEFRLLSLVEKHRDLIAAEVDLHPARAEQVAAMQEWVRGAQALRSAMPDVKSALSMLAARRADWTGDQKFLYDSLAGLEHEMRGFTAPATGVLARVEQRLDWARTFEDKTLVRYADEWRRAAQAIRASPRYGQYEMKPQAGLVPLGESPQSGLHEFLHLRSHGADDLPGRKQNGEIACGDETGIVFVLIPGARVWVGSQRADPDGPNYDAEAQEGGTVREVDQAPFLISKYEVSQGQWYRATHTVPSHYRPKDSVGGVLITWSHPLESISWASSVIWLRRLSLAPPTEAQWEHAARGGTQSKWATGEDRESLRGYANLADATAKKAWPSMRWEGFADWPEFVDGWAIHAPVHEYRPNGFGLHCIHGNVSERCYSAVEKRTVVRGGSFHDTAGDARVAYRMLESTEGASHIGLRPVWPLRE